MIYDGNVRFIMEWYSDFRKISLSRVWNVQGLLCSSFILVAFVSLAKAHLGTKECVLFVRQRYKGTFGHHSGAITLENVLLDHFFTSRSSGEAENKELEEKMIQIFTSRSSTTGTEKQMSVPARTCRLSSSKYFNSFPPT